MAGIDDLPLAPMQVDGPTKLAVTPEAQEVKTIQGLSVEEFEMKREAGLKQTLYVEPKDEIKFLEQENELLKTRNDNKEYAAGRTPLDKLSKYWAIIGAGATAFKLATCN